MPVPTCREEVLAVAQYLTKAGRTPFTPADVIQEMNRRRTRFQDTTIRTHVASRMCQNAPANHKTHYEDLERVGHASYRLR